MRLSAGGVFGGKNVCTFAGVTSRCRHVARVLKKYAYFVSLALTKRSGICKQLRALSASYRPAVSRLSEDEQMLADSVRASL